MEIFLSALLGSLLSTLPIGPINLVLMRLALLRRWEAWVSCVLGVLIADAFYSLASLGSYGILKHHIESYLSFGLPVLAIVLILFGVGLLLPRRDDPHAWEFKGRFGYFIFGLTATLVEPALPFFWLSWWSVLHLSSPNLIYAASGIFAGDVLVFGAYAYLARLFPKPDSGTERRIGRGIGAVLILIALYLLCKWQWGTQAWLKV